MTAGPVDLSSFAGWLTFAELADTSVPRDAGVYVIVRPTDDPPQFRPDAPYRGDAPLPLTDLHARWVVGERLVYIGMASLGAKRDGLHRRLRQFRRYGEGHAARHSLVDAASSSWPTTPAFSSPGASPMTLRPATPSAR